MKTPAFSSTKKEVRYHLPPNLTAHDRARTYFTGTVHVDDGLMFFSSSNIRVVYTRENKPRLTLATVYKIRKRNYLYEYIFPGLYKLRLENDVNVDFVPFTCIRGEHSSLM